MTTIPTVSKLPKGFADWAIKRAMSPDGVMRAELCRKSGQDCSWLIYLERITPPGRKVTIERVGRENRFRMTR
jgi:hypothetical protein